jgi:hypothetical protein
MIALVETFKNVLVIIDRLKQWLSLEYSIFVENAGTSHHNILADVLAVRSGILLTSR